MKDIKVTNWHGQRDPKLEAKFNHVRRVPVRSSNGRYSRARSFFPKAIASILIVLAFISWGPQIWGGKQFTAYAQETVQVDYSPEKIEKIKKDVVNQVQACESAGHKESDGIIIFDSNKVPSIGTLQFQTKTVIHYYKVLYNKTITQKEAVLIALDDEKAEQLAKDILFKEKDSWKNWFNCSKKLSIGQQIQLIQKLEVIE